MTPERLENIKRYSKEARGRARLHYIRALAKQRCRCGHRFHSAVCKKCGCLSFCLL